MASADLRDELLFSICLSIYTDPVMLRCGHNFCRVCIDLVLDTQDGSGGYSCPECGKGFRKWLALMRNLREIMKILENLLTTQPTQRVTGIDTYSPVPAKPQPTQTKTLPSDGGKGLTKEEGNIFGKGPADILLDVNTAHNNLHISDDRKTVTRGREKQKCPDTAERFQDCPQVMSSRGFTSGRHYWDVEAKGTQWRVGMCYPSIDRRGRVSYIGDNNKSWCLWGTMSNKCLVRYDRKVIRLPHQISSDRFRICVDYEAGELSFYELCDPIRHLHTFSATFTEPLHAVLRVFDGSIKILPENSIRSFFAKLHQRYFN